MGGYKQAAEGKPGRLAVTIDGESVLLKREALTVVVFDDAPLAGGASANDDDEPPPLV